MSISNIFQINGEQHFRNIEEKITFKALKANKNIISLGFEYKLMKKLEKKLYAIIYLFGLIGMSQFY